jgi:uncharacterized protein with PQ loop repeat
VSETTLGLVAASWGVIMALPPVMQIRRMMRLRSSRDVSIGYLLVIIVGFAIWIAYGIVIRDAALVVSPTRSPSSWGWARSRSPSTCGSRRDTKRRTRRLHDRSGCRQSWLR